MAYSLSNPHVLCLVYPPHVIISHQSPNGGILWPILTLHIIIRAVNSNLFHSAHHSSSVKLRYGIILIAPISLARFRLYTFTHLPSHVPSLKPHTSHFLSHPISYPIPFLIPSHFSPPKPKIDPSKLRTAIVKMILYIIIYSL